MEPLEFKCKLSKNYIEYKCNPNSQLNSDVFMEYYNIDHLKIKPFFVLLRTSIDALTKKGYKKIVQRVQMDDWNELKSNNKWKMRNIETLNNLVTVIIECNIEDALECISKGLGFVESSHN